MSNRFRNTTPSDWLHVATLGRTVGLKGEMKLNLSTDFPEQFVAGATFNLENGTVVTLQSYNPERGLVRLKGIDSPEAAKALTNARLFTTYEATRERCGLDEGEFFWFDMIGLSVREGDALLGTVREIERIGAQDYLLVATDGAFVSQGLPSTFLIPYIDHFIEKCDTGAKVIFVKGGRDLLEAS
ncbi:MAG: 16S rRNA processing protein RimM [Campylobacterales bacterium]|nr:16S rRNA processing protein RimM [Campylobacterales bacterium]